LTLAVTTVLVAVFVAVGWIQIRQSQKYRQHDCLPNEENVSWIFFSSLNNEYLTLRDSSRQAKKRYPRRHRFPRYEGWAKFHQPRLLVQSMQPLQPGRQLPDRSHLN
jgi:hypothetical protein